MSQCKVSTFVFKDGLRQLEQCLKPSQFLKAQLRDGMIPHGLELWFHELWIQPE